MTGEVRNALLVFVGGVLVLVVADGTYLHYVRPAAAPLVLVAGLVIIVLALIDVVRDLQGRPDPAAHGADGDGLGHDGTGHHETGRVAWLLLLPVLTVLLVSPPALGSDAVDLAGGRTAPTAAVPADDPLPPGDAPVLAVVDFVSRVAAMSSSGRAGQAGPLVGRDVTLTGFVVPARTGPGTDLTRLVISCCAADASPVRVHLADPVGALVPRMAAPSQGDRWLRVRGRLVTGTGTAADGFVPTIRVVDAADVPPAVPAYEY